MKPKTSNLSVSIVVRTNNSETLIGETLTCLYTQSYTRFDLTVVDYSSNDRTRDIVKQFPCKRFMIPAEKYNPGIVLNHVMGKTTGEIIVFLNADASLVSPDSLRRLIDVFEDPSVDAAFGRQIARPEATNATMDFYETTFPETGPAPSWLVFSMPFAAMRRSVWLQRPFSEETLGAEDIEWGLWARKNGLRIEYVPQAAVRHSHNYQQHHLRGGHFVEGDADAFLPFDGHQFLGTEPFTRTECLVAAIPFAQNSAGSLGSLTKPVAISTYNKKATAAKPSSPINQEKSTNSFFPLHVN